jgi:protein-L-isoaspartate(D-aspartate) O-methyltransferase
MDDQPSDRKARRFPLRLDQVAAAPRGALQPREVLRPQAPLEQAERDRRIQSIPQGLGMDSKAVQRRMVERLHADGIRHARVLDAFSTIPRHWFVDSALVNQAYEDTSLPIGLGQTISKPSVIGSMIELLCARPGLDADHPQPLGQCLDIGTGCGYQAALLSCLARRVVSVERLRDLHHKARTNLDRLRRDMPGWQDVRLVFGDGCWGMAPTRRMTPSSRRQAAHPCRRRGWISWRQGGASSRPWRIPVPGISCSPWSIVWPMGNFTIRRPDKSCSSL